MTQAMAASPAHFSSTCSRLKVSVVYLVTSAPCFLFLATLKSLKVLSKTFSSFTETPQSDPSTSHNCPLPQQSLFSCYHPFLPATGLFHTVLGNAQRSSSLLFIWVLCSMATSPALTEQKDCYGEEIQLQCLSVISDICYSLCMCSYKHLSHRRNG